MEVAESLIIDIKPELEVSLVHDKCAEIYRNHNDFTFFCNVCDQTFVFGTIGGSEEVFKHLDNHYQFENGFEEHKNFIAPEIEQIDQQQEQNDDDTSSNPIHEVFLDIEYVHDEDNDEDADDDIDIKETTINEYATTIKPATETNEHYRCNVCFRKFIKKSFYKKHCEKHNSMEKTEKQTLYCKICDVFFSTRGHLAKHNIVAHDGTEEEYSFYTCDICQCSVTTKMELEDHLLSHIKEKMLKDTGRSEFECDECGKVLANIKSLKGHKLIHTADRPIYECHLCGMKYVNKSTRTKHYKRTHPGFSAPDTYQVKRSTTKKISEENYPCKVCDKVFTTRSKLTRHMTYHLGVPTPCDICGKQFKTRDHLTRHKDVHDPSTKKHECNICGKKFRLTFNLTTHLRIHSGEKPYECKHCHKHFIYGPQLKNHISRVHFNIRPFQCEQCGKKYAAASLLNDHMKRHTNDRPAQCRYCDKRFYNGTLRNVHERQHTGEKPFKCKDCSSSFSSYNGLREHVKQHTGERPYPCRFCDMKFAQGGARKGHERSKHGAL